MTEASYGAHLRKRLYRSRFQGFFFSLVAIAVLVMFFVKVISPWMVTIFIGYLLGTIFMNNITYQDIKVGSPWPKINAALSVVCYILAIGLMIYGFINGELSFI